MPAGSSDGLIVERLGIIADKPCLTAAHLELSVVVTGLSHYMPAFLGISF